MGVFKPFLSSFLCVFVFCDLMSLSGMCPFGLSSLCACYLYNNLSARGENSRYFMSLEVLLVRLKRKRREKK